MTATVPRAAPTIVPWKKIIRYKFKCSLRPGQVSQVTGIPSESSVAQQKSQASNRYLLRFFPRITLRKSGNSMGCDYG